MKRRTFLKSFLTLGATGVLGASAYPVYNCYRFLVNKHSILVHNLRQPLRIAHLSDLHYGPFMGRGMLERWFQACMAEQPDLILITGDFVDRELRGSVDPLMDSLGSLQAPLGIWGVWGNHDVQHVRSTRAAMQALLDAGVGLLENQGAMLRPDLYLAGIDDAWTGRPLVSQSLASRVDASIPTILMTHNPDMVPQIPLDVDLCLAGHTHGGQLRLPGVGALYTASDYGEKFAYGWVSEEGLPRTFVSRGLGVSQLPLRLNCPAEVVIIDLLPS